MLMLILFLLSVVGTQPANIEVFRDSVIGTVSPFLFSSGDEMNEDLSHQGLDSLVSFVGIPLLRMGGISSEYLDWEANDYNGIWYIDVDTFMIPDTLNFGVDSLLQFCERVGAEPILTVNFQINDPAKAARMVEYCNGDTNTPMGKIRAQKGHLESYNVTYWCIGNEPDISSGALPTPWGNWTFYRHFGIPFDKWTKTDSSFVTKEEFATLVGVYVDSMRARSPIPLKIGGIGGIGNLEWIKPVISENNDKIDWLDLHYYPCSGDTADSNYYRDWLAAPDTGTGPWGNPPIEDLYKQVCDSVEKYSGEYNIPVHIFEFNSGIIMYYDALWWNYLNGLFIADVLGHFMKAGVPMSAVYCIYDKEPITEDWWSGAIIRGDTLSMRAACWVLKLYLDCFGDTLIKTTSDVFGLNVYGSTRDDTLAIVVINKSLDSACTATINLQGFMSNDTIQAWDITNDTILAAPWNGTKGIIYRGKYSGDSTTFTYTFPKASVTMLWIEPKESGVEEIQSQEFKLQGLEVFPNPFNSTTSIRYLVSSPEHVELKIYNLMGQSVKTLMNGQQKVGTYSITWDNRNDKNRLMPSGIYFCKLKIGNKFSQTNKLLILK